MSQNVTTASLQSVPFQFAAYSLRTWWAKETRIQWWLMRLQCAKNDLSRWDKHRHLALSTLLNAWMKCCRPKKRYKFLTGWRIHQHHLSFLNSLLLVKGPLQRVYRGKIMPSIMSILEVRRSFKVGLLSLNSRQSSSNIIWLLVKISKWRE